MAPRFCNGWMPRGIVGPLALVAGAALCLLSVTPWVRAALPGPVKQCKYSDSTTADKPCTADLYVGQHMTYECASADTPGPAKANAAGGNYCPTPLEDTGDCAKPEALDTDIGTTAADSKTNTVTLRLKEDYTEKFKDVIKYHVRCAKAGGDKIFIAVTLWPFSMPLTAAPTKKTCANATDTGTTYMMRCNFYIFKSDPTQDFDCQDSGTPKPVPNNAYDQAGNVCATGFKNASVVCAGDQTTPWNTVAKGVAIGAKNTNQTITINTSKMTVKRAVVYIGCIKGTGTKELFAKGMLFNDDFVKIDDSYVKMIKHVCTPEKGKAVDSPCEVTLAANEAVVMVCTPFMADTANYKLMPDDTNTKNGKFCTKKPAKFDADCGEYKKWVDDAKAVVSMDASMDFFLVAFPKANADQLKTQVVAYGYCSNKTNGLAWKLTLGGANASSPPSSPGPTSAAAPPTGNTGVAVGFLTLVAASFVAAAAM